jgi:hypothetical protein
MVPYPLQVRTVNTWIPCFGLVSLGVEPPPELNRRPHPYHGTTGNRCAERRSRRSRPTVGVEVIGSLSPKLCVLFQPSVLSVSQPESADIAAEAARLPW